jgi:hypothetical protein
MRAFCIVFHLAITLSKKKKEEEEDMRDEGEDVR